MKSAVRPHLTIFVDSSSPRGDYVLGGYIYEVLKEPHRLDLWDPVGSEGISKRL